MVTDGSSLARSLRSVQLGTITPSWRQRFLQYNIQLPDGIKPDSLRYSKAKWCLSSCQMTEQSAGCTIRIQDTYCKVHKTTVEIESAS